MLQILVISHGSLSEALVNSAKLIAGETEGVKWLGLYEGEDIENFKEKIKETIIEMSQNDEVLVLTDLMFGSPFNLVSQLMDELAFEHITGINLPIYLELLLGRQFNSKTELIKNVMMIAEHSVKYVNEMVGA